jgi:hypothetical protein
MQNGGGCHPDTGKAFRSCSMDVIAPGSVVLCQMDVVAPALAFSERVIMQMEGIAPPHLTGPTWQAAAQPWQGSP